MNAQNNVNTMNTSLVCFFFFFWKVNPGLLVNCICLIHIFLSVSSVNSFRNLKVNMYVFMVESECFK